MRKFSLCVVANLIAITINVSGISGLVHAEDSVNAPRASIEFSRNPDVLIVSYTLSPGEMAEAYRGPSLRIYGDGLTHVHYPVYMTRAGDYGLQLSEYEMTELLESLVADGVVEFDPGEATDTARETDTLRRENAGIMHYVTDPSTSVFEIHLLSYTAGGSPGLQKANLSKTVRWSGLQSDANLYPDLVPIQNLASAERKLRALMERSDLVRLDTQNLLTSPHQARD